VTTDQLFTAKRYGPKLPLAALIICPHGDPGDTLLKIFPELITGLSNAEQILLRRYLKIEQDRGSRELSDAIAKELLDNGLGAIVFSMNYPRGILDGGRVISHCIRDVLSSDKRKKLEKRFTKIHENSIGKLQTLYKEINQSQGYLIDVHTMASFSPGHPNIGTQPVTPGTIANYIKQFTEATKCDEARRRFDLISCDEEGELLADTKLKSAFENELNKANIEIRHNYPYAAAKHFMMFPNLTSASGICFDIPKHLLSKEWEHPNKFDLENFDLCKNQIKMFASITTRAIMASIDLSRPRKRN
tara:strand:+ start:732 stop:1640 length:909 start_codon:yes stop_codon:yes gene_type:complete